MALTPEDIQAVAAAVYNYGREDITIGGQVMHNAPLGQMVHGAWTALSDAAGAVPQMRGQVNALFHQAIPTADEIGTAVAAHLAGGGAASAAAIATAVEQLLAQKLAA